jgi:2,5-diketo-D-gluconate reductase A
VVDLYLIHWPAPRAGRFVESWKAMIRLKQEGRVRSIGVSNFRAQDLDRLISETGETPVLNQIELHPRFQQRPLRAVHEKYGMRTESWSPLGHGGDILSDPALRRIGDKYAKTAAQVVIRWHIDSGLIVIPKTVNPARLRENIDVFDFALAPEDMTAIAALDSAGGRIGPDPATANF